MKGLSASDKKFQGGKQCFLFGAYIEILYRR